MQWFESVVFALFPPFVAGVLHRPLMAALDLPDVWKGWWIPAWIARRVPARVIPSPADVAGHGPVHSSPAKLNEHWCSGVRRSWGLETWASIFVILPAAVAGTLALGGLVLTVHPSSSDDAQFAREHTLGFFSLSAGLGSAAVLWFLRSRSLYRRRLGASLPLTSAFHLARLLRDCSAAAAGGLALLELDQRVARYTNQLGWFAAYGVDRERRRAALQPHIARVQLAVETEMSNVLRDGPDAVPRLARLLATLLDRSVQGRWMGLLEESDLPTERTELVAPRGDRHDRWVLLGGSVAAAAVMGTAIVAGLPAAAVAPAALTALIGPAVMWGSDKLGTRREQAQIVAAAVSAAGSAAAEPPASAENPSAAGVPAPRA
ncbi:hypothetical protein GCM10010441_42810 [Kitasatospora paracochleata]|uniref:Uncharacterized protein n=1 Tax=Kitasatospora paracochleata TaxID=58354 RepID=A0ABT1J1B6_9ACTN|nr:hypothetical protein [Kitasatospora paracochleata]MCP2310933.1 hypothetical protein [Kitasatospora paracochleata]